MWTEIYLAKNNADLSHICTLLDSNGIIYRYVNATKLDEEGEAYFNVLVPAAEVHDAHALILDEEL